MTFPEKLQEHLSCQVSCPRTTSPVCPSCKSASLFPAPESNGQDGDSTSRIMPIAKFGKLNVVWRHLCRTCSVNIAGTIYAFCVSGSHIEDAATGLALWHRVSNFHDFFCGGCGEAFRLHLPKIEIPYPYLSEFVGPGCLLQALKNRKKTRGRTLR